MEREIAKTIEKIIKAIPEGLELQDIDVVDVDNETVWITSGGAKKDRFACFTIYASDRIYYQLDDRNTQDLVVKRVYDISEIFHKMKKFLESGISIVEMLID